MTEENAKVLRALRHYIKRGRYNSSSQFLDRLPLVEREKEEIQQLLNTLSVSRGLRFLYTSWRLSRKLDKLLERESRA